MERASLGFLGLVVLASVVACSGTTTPVSAPAPVASATDTTAPTEGPVPTEATEAEVPGEALPAAERPEAAEHVPDRRPVDRSTVITMAEFNQLANGISYDRAFEIIGVHGKELSRNRIGGTETLMVMWQNADGSNANAMFQNDRLMQRSQFGLPNGPSPVNLDKAIREREEAAAAERSREEESRRQAEAERRRQAQLIETDKVAAPELEALLAEPGDLTTIAGLDAFRTKVSAFAEKFDGTPSGMKATDEAAALAKLRLAYVWAEQPNRDATSRLKEIVSDHPGTLAAATAEARLSAP